MSDATWDCGVAWTTPVPVRAHCCDKQQAHTGPHECICGETWFGVVMDRTCTALTTPTTEDTYCTELASTDSEFCPTHREREWFAD